MGSPTAAYEKPEPAPSRIASIFPEACPEIQSGRTASRPGSQRAHRPTRTGNSGGSFASVALRTETVRGPPGTRECAPSSAAASIGLFDHALIRSAPVLLRLLAVSFWLAGAMPQALIASAAEKPVATGLSLELNGNFEQPDSADKSKPTHWDKPDGLGVQWAEAPNDSGGQAHGKAIRMNTAISEKAMVEQWKKMGLTQWTVPKPAGNAIAETYGLSYYSDPIPVKSGQTYRITFDFKGASGGAKVWVRGWGLLAGQKRRRYETIVNCRTKDNQWTTFSQEFSPTKNRPEVTEMRVMLYAYYPAGIYWFDNVRIEPVSTAGN